MRFSMKFDEIGIDKAKILRHHISEGRLITSEEKAFTVNARYSASHRQEYIIKDDGKAHCALNNEPEFEKSVWEFISSSYSHPFCFLMPDYDSDPEWGGATFFKYQEFLQFSKQQSESCLVTFIEIETDLTESFFTTLCTYSRDTALQVKLKYPTLWFDHLNDDAMDALIENPLFDRPER